MKIKLTLLLLILLQLSCKNDTEKKIETWNNRIDKQKSDSVLKTEADSAIEDNSDCVFESDYKKVTEEWLKDLDIKKYVWNSKTKKAIVIYNGDTLTLFRGGCNHFVSSVEIKTGSYPNKELDSTLLRKINDVACKFNFINYCEKIKKGQFKKITNNASSFYLEFEDDNLEDNIIYEGIQILEKEKRTIINISEYYD